MTDPNRADLELPAREPFTGWDVDPLDATPPDAPAVKPGCFPGCLPFVVALLLLALAVGG